MSRGGLIKAAAAACCCALALLFAASAAGEGALVIVNDIVLRADGGFQPRALPRRQFAPIEFHGHFEVGARGGGRPPTLEEAVIDFDRDGRLSVGGLPTCPLERVADVGTAAARKACKGAIVGSGEIQALVALPAGLARIGSSLTLFNGPPRGGNPTAILHAPAPDGQILALVAPIERRPGPFRYRVTLDFPPIAGGLGTISRVAVKVGRRFSAGGQRRSYVSAHCSDGILHTHGRFTFSDGTIVDGSVEKACRVR